MYSFISLVNKHLGFSSEERKGFWIASFILAFVWSFDKWGYESFNLGIGMKNLIIAFAISSSVLYVHHATQRIYGLWTGVKTEFSIWWYGVIIGLVLLIITNGKLMWLAFTGTTFLCDKRIRLKRFRLYSGYFEYAMVSLSGLVGVMSYSAIFKTLDIWFSFPSIFGDIINQLFLFTLFYTFWNLFPLPPIDGSKILFGSRLLYVLVGGFFLSYILLVILAGLFSFAFALIGALIIWLFYYSYGEK